MATPGQPTLYKPEYCELAHNDCLLGATNELLGDFFGVTCGTIQNWIATASRARHAGNQGGKVGKVGNLPLRPAGNACTDRLLLRVEKALLPMTVILEPCNGTQKFALLRAEPAGRERCGESMRHAGG
jgi:hypothetical protein